MNRILLTEKSIFISEEGVNRSTSIQELRTMFPLKRESLVLPNGTIRYSRKGARQHFLLETPLQKRRIYISTRSRDNETKVWWPPSIWSVILDEQGVMDIKIVFLNQSFYESDESSPTYLSPYGNQYGNTGICWSNIQLPIIHKEMDIERIPSLFFDSIFNGDLRHRVALSSGALDKPSLGRLVGWGSKDSFLPTLLHEENTEIVLKNQTHSNEAGNLGHFLQKRDRDFKGHRL